MTLLETWLWCLAVVGGIVLVNCACLNGVYLNGGETMYDCGIVWNTYILCILDSYSLNMTEIKIAP